MALMAIIICLPQRMSQTPISLLMHQNVLFARAALEPVRKLRGLLL